LTRLLIAERKKENYMNFLEEKILTDGVIKPGNILKVDSFLNHQIDVDIIRQIAYELKRRFKGVDVTKILTIEASGIAIATLLGDLYDVPVVFAKKGETANSTDDKYVSQAYSFTHKKMNNVFISRPYLHEGEKVLIVDDFLADGQAVHALIDLIGQAHAEVAGIGIAIEKGQQEGGRRLRSEGYRLESIAIIEAMDCEKQTVCFRDQFEHNNGLT
jgi:xanthine phosphoribosyltransferase